MEKPQHTKPFNLEHAKAGAPIATTVGEKAYFVVHIPDAVKRSRVIVRYENGELGNRHEDGRHYNNDHVPGDLIMTPLGYIDGKPVFVGDEVVTPTGMRWVATPACRTDRSLGDCTWPAPAKVYPVTGLDPVDLVFLYENVLNRRGPDGGRHGAVLAVSNAALRHAIDSGQLMLPGGELDAETIIKAFDKAGLLSAMSKPFHDRIVSAVRSLLVTEPEIEQLRADLKRESMELGKAERLLESLGYRSAGNGDWQCCAAVGDRAARDMAIAIAVERETRIETARAINSNTPVSINLDAIITQVKS